MQQDCFFNFQQNTQNTSQKTPDESANIWWCQLIRDRRWSTAQKRQLIGHYKCPELALAAPNVQVRTIISGRQRNSTSIVEKSMLDADLHWLAQDSHYLIPITDQCYPAILRQLLTHVSNTWNGILRHEENRCP